MPSCSTNSTVNSQWQVKFTIKWVSYELVSSKINQKQKSFNEFQSATGPPVNTDKGERGVGGGGGLQLMASALHKELEYKVENLKYKTVGGHAAEDQNQIRTSSW